MEIPENLDLAAIDPLLKLPVFIERFDALGSGHVLVVSNDVDSRPLYHLLVADRGPDFQWEPLENGPEKWRIRILKSPVKNDEETIGNIISQDYRKSRALKNLGIDFSCGGNRTLDQAFAGKEITITHVLRQWETIDQRPSEKGMNFLSWDMAFLTRYIIQLHHRYVSTQTKFITELAFKVAESNSHRNPEIKEIAELFAHTGKIFEEKDQNEEKVLFPYIIKLSEANTNGATLKAAGIGPIYIAVSLLQVESEKVVAGLLQIRQLTNDYIASAYTSSTCPILYKLLAAYEDDALLHLHLENNILFPRAIKTENSLRSKNKIS
ncbi:DUF542 domain-containing protein [Mucilaginibacter sp.]|uniref:DUF542 domain-containing protein n=1 Tax=Mucilaginibacter sp. TaxID=1882438 RepID=UPI00261BF541|nr:DUF542 domain-containing protein [Mucilaginibacter sp.]MDB5032092.1 ric [Mucilaginibacter sp.]